MSTLLSTGHENTPDALCYNYTYIRPWIKWMLPDAELNLNGHTLTERHSFSLHLKTT